MTWLVTGGAGYIGSHVVKALQASGRNVAVIDDLSTGDIKRVPADVHFFESRVHSAKFLRDIADTFTGVIHCAGKKSVSESVQYPLHYWYENVGGTIAILGAFEAASKPIIFSSSAAVYAPHSVAATPEHAPIAPVSPYGHTKAACEQLLRNLARHRGLSYITLRYFNVIGSGDPALVDHGNDNLVPRVFAALDNARPPVVFGSQYATPDGSCVRDYVHVMDVAEAHVAAARWLEKNAEQTQQTFNVGTGQGASVLQMLRIIGEVTGRDAQPLIVNRREGDAPYAVADVAKIARDLGWRSRFTIEEAVRSAWTAWNA